MNFWITSGDGVAPPLLADTSFSSVGSFNNAVKHALSTFNPLASNCAIIRSIVACGTVSPVAVPPGTVVVSSGKTNPEPGGPETVGPETVGPETIGRELDLVSLQADNIPSAAMDASAAATTGFM